MPDAQLMSLSGSSSETTKMLLRLSLFVIDNPRWRTVLAVKRLVCIADKGCSARSSAGERNQIFQPHRIEMRFRTAGNQRLAVRSKRIRSIFGRTHRKPASVRTKRQTHTIGRVQHDGA